MESTAKRESVFSKMVRAGSKTYFIDVKLSSKGDKYLSVCESRKVDGEFQNCRVIVFGDHTQKFFEGLKEAEEAIG